MLLLKDIILKLRRKKIKTTIEQPEATGIASYYPGIIYDADTGKEKKN